MIHLLRRLLGAAPRPPVEDADEPTRPPGEPDVQSVLVLVRSPDAFYHNLPDEEFCTWARGWSQTSQVLDAEDRERIIERIRLGHAALSEENAP